MNRKQTPTTEGKGAEKDINGRARVSCIGEQVGTKTTNVVKGGRDGEMSGFPPDSSCFTPSKLQTLAETVSSESRFSLFHLSPNSYQSSAPCSRSLQTFSKSHGRYEKRLKTMYFTREGERQEEWTEAEGRREIAWIWRASISLHQCQALGAAFRYYQEVICSACLSTSRSVCVHLFFPSER